MIRTRADKVALSIAVVLVLILAYGVATDSPFAIWALFFVVGYLAGGLPVYLAIRAIERRRTLAGRLTWGYILVSVASLGLGTYVVLPELVGGEHTVLGGFEQGLGFGVGFTAIGLYIRRTSGRRAGRG